MKRNTKQDGCNDKGQSAFVTHAILLGFVIFLIFIIVNTFLTLREEFQDFTAKSELEQVCFILRSGIEKLVPDTDYRPQTNTTSKIDINLPEKMAGTSYVANFENRSINIFTLSPRFNSTCRIGFNVTYVGFTSGGLTEILFIRNLTNDIIEMKSV